MDPSEESEGVFFCVLTVTETNVHFVKNKP